MKKIILLFSLVMNCLYISHARAFVANQVDCDAFAADYVAVIEEYFGCMTSEDYNRAYTTVRDNCLAMPKE